MELLTKLLLNKYKNQGGGGPSEYNAKVETNQVPIPSGQTNTTIRNYVKEVPPLNVGNLTSLSSFFSFCSTLERGPLLDTSRITVMTYMFQNCDSLLEVPQYNMQKVDNMQYMFSGCISLETIPELDIPLVVPYYMLKAFSNCTSLTDESLNNVLYAILHCKNEGTAQQKTLSWIGINSTQATKCTTLSNWSACAAKGWTTGY